MPYRSNLPAIRSLIDRATQNGLRAAVRVPQSAIKRALRGGYTSGAFVTGVNVNAIMVSEPFLHNGQWRIAVYVPETVQVRAPNPNTGDAGETRDMIYVLAWELGHVNLFTRRYERQERIRPAFNDSGRGAHAAFERAFRRTMEAG